MLSLGIDANNHINNSGFGYDAAGNLTQDGTSGVTYSFDAENRLYKITGISGGPYCYFYDGNGLRVAKKSGANSDCTGGTFMKLYWRSTSGDALAETDSTGSTTNVAYNEYVFFSGRRIASRDGTGTIFYYFADQVGSTRTITTGNGTGQTPGQLCYDADFTPYGLEIQHTEHLQTTACPPNYKFTGYERDSETGLDYAFARYYSPSLNRFYSTDPLGGSIGSLQSHNAYAYVLNNPLNFTDPTGLGPCGQSKFGATKQFCSTPAGGGAGLGCMLDGVIESCGTVSRLAGAGALDGVSSPLPTGGNGTITIWLSGGSVQSISNPSGQQSESFTTSFPGQWVTLSLGGPSETGGSGAVQYQQYVGIRMLQTLGGTLKKPVLEYLCGPSANQNLTNYIVEGATKGAIYGFRSGGWWGALDGAVVGGGGGMLTGMLATAACSEAGVYPPGSKIGN